MNNYAQLSELANSHLNLLLSNNDCNSLDLCCPLDDLSRSKWQIEYNAQVKYHTTPINVLKMQFIKGDTVIAVYTIYLGKDLEFLDEFFIS